MGHLKRNFPFSQHSIYFQYLCGWQVIFHQGTKYNALHCCRSCSANHCVLSLYSVSREALKCFQYCSLLKTIPFLPTVLSMHLHTCALAISFSFSHLEKDRLTLPCSWWSAWLQTYKKIALSWTTSLSSQWQPCLFLCLLNRTHCHPPISEVLMNPRSSSNFLSYF